MAAVNLVKVTLVPRGCNVALAGDPWNRPQVRSASLSVAPRTYAKSRGQHAT